MLPGDDALDTALNVHVSRRPMAHLEVANPEA
jgi:hypothetical protein